jgi:peptidoglycan hydrolase-like protein with peptidoglycan-binding domain
MGNMNNTFTAVKRKLLVLTALGLTGGMLFFVTPAAQAATCVQQDWGIGNSGACVQDIQSLLNTLGSYFNYAHFSTLAVDGQFGSLTQGQVKAFQAFTGNTQDGIVGPHTWSSICSDAQFVHEFGQTRADGEINVPAKAAGCAWAQ